MNKSESISALAKALVDAQKEISNPLNTKVNPFYKSKYAPLADILTLVRPILEKHGLAIVQDATREGENITIKTLLLHVSGEWLEQTGVSVRVDKDTAQGAGSAITYARRYALSAMLSISSEDDDDGETSAHEPKIEKKTEPPKPTATMKAGNLAEFKKAFAAADTDAKKETLLKAVGTRLWTDAERAEIDALFNPKPFTDKEQAELDAEVKIIFDGQEVQA
jgi:hypothetical protein